MKEYEDNFCQSVAKTYNLHIEDAVFAKGLIPRKILLDKTRNIHSYIIVCKITPEKLLSSYWKENDMDNTIRNILAIQYSELDRYLFFVYRDNNNCIKSIEGNFLREYLLDNPQTDIVSFIKNNSENFIDVCIKIHKEL